MKTQLLAVLSAGILTATGAFAQTAVQQTTTSTTTSLGTISEFSPDTIVIRSETSPQPIRYRYSKTTTYVDETGAPVSIETVKSGLPVTVHYIKEGDQMVASKVIVRRAAPATTTTTTVAPAPAPVVEKKSTTTTTTTNKKD